MLAMDFEFLRSGAVHLALTFTAALNTTLPQAASPVSSQLQTPIILASENLSPSETIQDLNSVAFEEAKLEMVIKEPEALPSQDVMFYTVVQPTPKPKEKEEDGIEIIKEVKAVEKKEEVKEADASTSPNPSSIPSTASSPAPVQALTSSNADKLFQMVNDHRAKLGLKAFEKDDRLCKIARDRAPQVNSELNSGTLHKGFKDLNLPYWATENIAAYQTIEENLRFWLSDYIHKKAIEGDSKFSCLACEGSSCSQVFTSFINK